MTITIGRVHRPPQEGTLRAFVDVILDGKVTLRGCRLIAGGRGLFVAMPSQKSEKDGKWYDIVQVQDDALRGVIHKAVLAAYEQQMAGSTMAPSGQRTPAIDGDTPY